MNAEVFTYQGKRYISVRDLRLYFRDNAASGLYDVSSKALFEVLASMLEDLENAQDEKGL